MRSLMACALIAVLVASATAVRISMQNTEEEDKPLTTPDCKDACQCEEEFPTIGFEDTCTACLEGLGLTMHKKASKWSEDVTKYCENIFDPAATVKTVKGPQNIQEGAKNIVDLAATVTNVGAPQHIAWESGEIAGHPIIGKDEAPADLSSLPNCIDIESYRFSYVDQDKSLHRGQCNPSTSPGAYFTKDSTEVWQCWDENTPQIVRTEEKASVQGFEGACAFREPQRRPEDVKQCDHRPTDCSPSNDMEYWGACHTTAPKKWSCIAKPGFGVGLDEVEKFVNGDCKAIGVRDDPDGQLYEGVCRFKEESHKNYKCDKVATYISSEASTCGGGEANYHSACFSRTKGVTWACFQDKLDNPGCTSTPSGDGSQYYHGTCFFPKADKEYKNAEGDQEPAEEHKPEQAATSSTAGPKEPRKIVVDAATTTSASPAIDKQEQAAISSTAGPTEQGTIVDEAETTTSASPAIDEQEQAAISSTARPTEQGKIVDEVTNKPEKEEDIEKKDEATTTQTPSPAVTTVPKKSGARGSRLGGAAAAFLAGLASLRLWL